MFKANTPKWLFLVCHGWTRSCHLSYHIKSFRSCAYWMKEVGILAESISILSNIFHSLVCSFVIFVPFVNAVVRRGTLQFFKETLWMMRWKLTLFYSTIVASSLILTALFNEFAPGCKLSLEFVLYGLLLVLGASNVLALALRSIFSIFLNKILF